MDEKGESFEKVMEELEEAHGKDFLFGDGRVLGSMCTKPLDGSVDVHSRFIESNLGNPGLYPGSKQLEEKIVSMVSSLLQGNDFYGQVQAGGTESNIVAATRTMRWMSVMFERR
jgi:tyrosine decarboxylase/aspartate 1-decarboxylase